MLNLKAQIVLTPSESKRLIAKAVSQMERVKNAMQKGIVVICRGSTNAFLTEELTGQKMNKRNFALGYIGPKGLIVNLNNLKDIVLIDGKPNTDLALADVVKDLRTGDVVIKGANAIGPDGIPGVLLSRRRPDTFGGTLGAFQTAAMARGVEIIIPVGLEKSIPVSVLIGSKEISSSKVEYATGIACGLVPVFGTVVTEVEAMRILSGVEVIPIGAGGVGGAEGSVVLLLKGTNSEVKQAIRIIEEIRGEPQLPEPR
ncbi:MAG: hypothetical protein QG670_1202 [Thermoproteota archaeon]|nr:hypothetical protein [Thermoproteota archaeon]